MEEDERCLLADKADPASVITNRGQDWHAARNGNNAKDIVYLLE
jgi:hypothetical protein